MINEFNTYVYLFPLDCTPPYRVTIVTDDTNNALGVAPLALPEEATLLSRGKYITPFNIECNHFSFFVTS